MTIENTLDRFCKLLGVDKYAILAKRSKGVIPRKRFAVVRALYDNGYTVSEIADLFDIDHSSATYIVNATTDRYQDYRSLLQATQNTFVTIPLTEEMRCALFEKAGPGKHTLEQIIVDVCEKYISERECEE